MQVGFEEPDKADDKGKLVFILVEPLGFDKADTADIQ